MATAADLLFRISADSTPAQADLEAFRGAVADATGDAGEQLDALAERTVSSEGPAREALRGLGEEIGVHLPRFVSSYLASLGPVAGIASAAFAPIAVIGLVEVIGKIPGAIEKGVDALHGWTEAAKKAFEESTKAALKWQVDSIDIMERLRAVQLIGKEGIQKYNLEMTLNSQNISEVAKKIDELRLKQTELNAVVAWKPPPESSFLSRVLGLAGGPADSEVDKAKEQLKEIDPIIDSLTTKLRDLTIKGMEIPAQRAAETAKETKKSLEDFRGFSELLDEIQSKMAKATSPEADSGVTDGGMNASLGKG